MFMKTLRDIEAYIEYLEKTWGRVCVELSGGAPEQLSRKLKKHEALRTAPECEKIEVSHNGRHIACIYYPQNGRPPAAVIPLRYMLEKLFEQYRESDQAPDACAKSLSYIREHYTEKISVSDIADSVGYSSSYFGYIFKKKHGIPVNKYILGLRLSKAAELLSDTSLSISSVAENVGFDDPNYFSTVFKASYGLSPRQYRVKKAENRQTS